MAGLFGAVAHDLGQSLPNTFHRTAGNAYEAVAGKNGVLTGKGLKSVAKTAAGLLGVLNFVPTVAGLATAGLANGIYNKISGKGGFREGATQPTKRAINHVKDGISGTGEATGQLVKGTAKAIGGVLTAPLDIAFGATRGNMTLQPDYNKGVQHTDYVTASAPIAENKTLEQTKKSETPTPIPVPIPTGGSNNPEKEAKKAQEKADKEAKDAEKKAEKEQKKEEEKTAKEEIAKTVDDLNKQQKTFITKIDGAIKKVEELTSAEKMRDKIDQYDKQIKIVQEDILDKIDIEKRKSLTTPRGVITLDTIGTLPDDRPLDPATSGSIDEKDQYDFIQNLVNSIVPIIENGISREETENLPTTKVKKDRYSSNREEGFEELIRIKKKVNKTPMEALKKEDIRNLKLYIGSDQNDEGIVEKSFFGDIKTINQNKKNNIDAKPEHIEKQQDKLVDALNKMKTESGKAISSIASSSRLGGKKLNKDNAGDALEQLTEAMNTVTEQASAGEKRIDMSKPITGISDSYQSLLNSIQSITS